MNLESMTDDAVAQELGRRVEQLRLERNMTQQQVADAVGVSRVTYAKLESGEAKLVTLVAVLRVFDQLALLDKAIPASVFSPLEQLKLQGKRRQRATGTRGRQSDSGDNSEALDW